MNPELEEKIKQGIRSVLASKPNSNFEQIQTLFKYTNPQILNDETLLALCKEFFENEKSKIKLQSNL
jgi:hypothetical protein